MPQKVSKNLVSASRCSQKSIEWTQCREHKGIWMLLAFCSTQHGKILGQEQTWGNEDASSMKRTTGKTENHYQPGCSSGLPSSLSFQQDVPHNDLPSR
nr:hypothetical protein Iba_chr10dCG2880 [Ipomoea batatas]